LPRTEAALNGRRLDAATATEVGKVASEETDATGDFHASIEYRKSLTGTLLERALVEAAGRQS
jgi:carbon-monoxide dehydrogenase medium subunit